MSSLDDFFRYNLPIQVMPDDDGETLILVYMPRKERMAGWMSLAESVPEGATREEFFNRAADIYENLAKLMRHAATEPKAFIYYPTNAPSVVED